MMQDYFKIEGLQNVDATFFASVEDAAAGLTEADVLLVLGSPSLNEVEKEWFDRAYAKGRAIAKKRAVDNLFASMRDKGGHSAALSYLARFADKWNDELGKPVDGTFRFEVKM